MSAETPAVSSPLSSAEIEAFATQWYRKLDQHAPAEEVVAMVAGERTEFFQCVDVEPHSHTDVFKLMPAPRLEFVLPEGVLTGVAAFREWYEGVLRLFFDEVHTLTEVRLTGQRNSITTVKVLINWQARRWRPPHPRSEWIGFDADQDWELVRSASTGQPVVTRYVVNDLRPMPGSSRL
jgi:hypothetical protein